MTFSELYNELPFLEFAFVVLYTLLGILRIKRFLKLPLLILVFLMGFVPGIWFVLPVFAVFELTIQIIKVIGVFFNGRKVL